jgi:hypothetical protein
MTKILAVIYLLFSLSFSAFSQHDHGSNCHAVLKNGFYLVVSCSDTAIACRAYKKEYYFFLGKTPLMLTKNVERVEVFDYKIKYEARKGLDLFFNEEDTKKIKEWTAGIKGKTFGLVVNNMVIAMSQNIAYETQGEIKLIRNDITPEEYDVIKNALQSDSK